MLTYSLVDRSSNLLVQAFIQVRIMDLYRFSKRIVRSDV